MAGDPNFSSVVLLLHMDATGSPDEALDSSNSGHVTTFVGAAGIDEATVKFGSGSLHTDGAGDYLTLPDSDDWELGSGDFTLESWINADVAAGTDGVIGRDATGGANNRYVMFIDPSGLLGFYAGASAFSPTVQSTTDLRGAGWVHWAVTRENDTFRLFIDGVEEDSRTESFTITTSNELLHVGTDPTDASNRSLNGYIDDLRITKGVARYTANFTPPTQAFPNGAGASASGVAGANPVVTVLGG